METVDQVGNFFVFGVYERKAVSVGDFLVSLIWLMAARANSKA